MRDLYRLPSPDAPKSFVLRVLGIYLLGLACVAWALTQLAADRLSYAPELGLPSLARPESSRTFAWGAGVVLCLALALLPFRRGRRVAFALLVPAGALYALSRGPLYTPAHFFWWAIHFRDPLLVADFWKPGLEVLGVVGALGLLIVLAILISAWPRLSEPADIHGSARWAAPSEVRDLSKNFASLPPYALLLGRDPYQPNRYLSDPGPTHAFVFAPTRSGKGVGLVIPNLLSWRGSVLVHDMKGENWDATAGWRSSKLGSTCLRLDPTCSDGTGARYNPLSEIRIGPQEVRDAQNVADILVDPNGDKLRDHWDRTAHALLVGVILHVLYAEPDKTLAGCANFLAHPARDITASLQRMLTGSHAAPGRGWTVDRTETLTHPVVAAAARELLDKSPNERSGVLSTALSFLNLYRDPILAHNTAESDFRLEQLVTENISLYLAVPPSDLSRTRPLVRLLLNQACRRLTERIPPSEAELARTRAKVAPRQPLLLLLDEFPALGKLQFFQESLAYLAGYGIRAMLITQDLSQHQGVYGTQESITANCEIRIAFAPNKVETAELLSDMCGRTTIHHFHRSLRGSSLAPGNSPQSVTQQESERALLTPDETLRLPPDEELLLLGGRRPIRALKIRYYQDPHLAPRANLPIAG